ncbi:hypothetical protein [Chryseobacterium caseinilyticum]|uniref:Uncharacterized protein n=1 Tax=Chryseobacterium caseinilyticum TaxID=2771428 RepID=A0ABR8ZEK0_9FLAO|nr:hypothetical protein [Chryseobacterium caseinilyticum]MBD8083320.1 hypothetical protein [Chryseobacterium caseinilyticum]
MKFGLQSPDVECGLWVRAGRQNQRWILWMQNSGTGRLLNKSRWVFESFIFDEVYTSIARKVNFALV